MSHWNRRAVALVCLAVLPLPCSRGGVLVVGPTAPTYTQIQPAITAAAPGDVILVQSGSYSSFTINGKALTVAAEFGSTVVVHGTTSVVATPVGQTVVLSDLQLSGPDAVMPGPLAAEGLSVSANLGVVLLQSCRARGGQPAGAGYTDVVPPQAAGARAVSLTSNPGGVVFTDANVAASASASANDAQPCCAHSLTPPSAVGLRSGASKLALMSCDVRGGDGAGSGVGALGGNGVTLLPVPGVGGLFAMGSHVRGGNGGPCFETIFAQWGGDGGAGLSAPASTVAHVFSSTLSGGAGGVAFFPGDDGLAGPAVEGAGAMFAHGGIHVAISVPSVVHAGQTVVFRAEGTPGETVRLFASANAQFFYLPSWRGVLVPRVPASDSGMHMGVIPTSGVLQVNYVVPPLASGVTSRNLFVQAYRVDVNGGYALSNARCVTVLP